MLQNNLCKRSVPKCCGSLNCPKERNPASCGWIGTCLEEVRRKLRSALRKLKKAEMEKCKHHPMEIRTSDEVRADIKRQDDEAKREMYGGGR